MSFLTMDQLAYTDDDLELLVNICSEMIKQGTQIPSRTPSTSEDKTKNYRRFLGTLLRYQASGVPENRKEEISEIAYSHRAQNEIIRVMMLDQDRAQIRTGYSPSVCAWGAKYEPKPGNDGLFEATIERINYRSWKRVVHPRAAIAMNAAATRPSSGGSERKTRLRTTSTTKVLEFHR